MSSSTDLILGRQRQAKLITLALICALMAVMGNLISPTAARASGTSSTDDVLSEVLSTDKAKSIAKDIDLADKQKSEETLDKSDIKGWKLEDGNYLVGYGFTGDKFVTAYLMAIVTPEGKVVQTAETILKELTEDSGEAKSWVNGEKTVDDTFTDEDGEKAFDTQKAGYWQKVSDCLAGEGLAGWAAGALSTVCGATCATGVGCAICIASATGFSVGVITYCLGKAGGK
ncbi:hypothetical protein [Brevibacterium epidermidis]|jgi:hypothetical protein|uniref:hypothetical protein n=1 Tax=Brevibacterium epidermidis TaxID=1698 RepID=UPI000BF6B75E|nr:hypothetical protein [Brevibacterium epidermidis]